MNTVQKIKQKLQKENIQGLALDIDETLSSARSHYFSKLTEKFGNPEKLTIEEMIEKYRHTQNVPHWDDEKVYTFLEEIRHSNDLQKEYPLIEDAQITIQQIHAKIPIVLYLTGRPESVREGTMHWLEKHKFPKATGIFRPNEMHYTETFKWKAQILEELYPDVVGIIDDNLTLVAELSSSYKGTVFLYEITEHSRDDINVIPCKTWNDVYKQIKANIS